MAQLIPSILDKSGIYNLTDGLHPTFSEIEDALALAMGKKIRFKIPLFLLQLVALGGDLLRMLKIPFPLYSIRLKKMTATLTFDDGKARQELNWQSNSIIPFIEQGKTL